MAIAAPPRPLTYEDLLDTPEDSFGFEILQGELIVSPAPVPEHQLIAIELTTRVYDHVKRQQLGRALPTPIDVRLDEHNIVQPDLIFISRDRLHIVGSKLVDGAPDLVVEILSPSSRQRDLVRKAALYKSAGIREYWQVDPETRSVTMLTLRGGQYQPLVADDNGLLASEVLPGFRLNSAQLFESIGAGATGES